MSDRIPVYHLQHSIRLLVIGKWETTLSWDQLRSPQVSQFLVKPILQKIRASHSNKATLYALLANSLQFQKDGQMNPGTVGLSKTRALICELLAMRILRDYSTREVSYHNTHSIYASTNIISSSTHCSTTSIHSKVYLDQGT